MGGIALFMILTALVVLFPVVLQVRLGESRPRNVWGYFIFIVGLLLIAAGDTDPGRAYQSWLTVAGIVALVVGLVVQGSGTKAAGPQPRA